MVVPMARLGLAYNGRAISDLGAVHPWLLGGITINESTKFFARSRRAMSEAITN